MFTVLSNTRSSNRNLIIALAMITLVLLALVMVPSISLRSNSTGIPVTGVQNTDVNLAFRRGEWTTGVSAYQAYLDQRYGEQHQFNFDKVYFPLPHGKQDAIANAANKAYIDYRRGEWSGK